MISNNTLDQLTGLYDPITDEEYSYSYDIRGNLTSKQDYYGSYSYTWDYRNRLTETTIRHSDPELAEGEESQTVKYAYDSKDRRTSKTVIDIDASSSVIPAEAGIQTHTYKYDGWSVMEETVQKTDDSGQITGTQVIKYTYRDDNTPQTITLGSSTYYYVTDGHGDIREITDKAGNSLVKYSYDAFGNPTLVTPVKTGVQEELDSGSEAGMTLAQLNPYTYASYRYDSDTGMYYLRARYYDPVTGRFLSKDPILKESISKEISDIGKANPFVKDIADELVADIKSNHPYAYAKNNPVNFVDPSGLHSYIIVGPYMYLKSSYYKKYGQTYYIAIKGDSLRICYSNPYGWQFKSYMKRAYATHQVLKTQYAAEILLGLISILASGPTTGTQNLTSYLKSARSTFYRALSWENAKGHIFGTRSHKWW